MEPWRIHKDRTGCEKPDCPLARSAEYYVVLDLPDCVRRELCEPCFAERGAANPFYWKARRHAAGKQHAVLDLASLRQLFDRLGEPPAPVVAEDGTDDPQATAEARRTAGDLRYLVALLLLRKRILRMVDATTPAQEAADLVIADPKMPEMEPVCLLAPDLSSERLGSLKEELLAALEA